MSSRVEQRRRAREERETRERDARERARRRQRLWLLGGAALVAAAIAAALIAISRGGGEGLGEGEALAGAAEVRELFEGIPQRGVALGDPDAPVTMVEFADLQCPFCAQYARDALPEIVERYVRRGHLRMELRLLDFIGPDSRAAAAAAAVAAERDRLWQFADLLLRNQGAENSGYVTEEYLRRVARGAGLDPETVLDGAQRPKALRVLDRSRAEADRAGVRSTPSFLVGPTGGRLDPVQVDALTVDAFERELGPLLERSR